MEWMHLTKSVSLGKINDFCDKVYRRDDDLILRSPHGELLIKEGDWLLRLSSGDVYLFHPAAKKELEKELSK